MTCICGVRVGDVVVLAADRRSAVNSGRDIISESAGKLLRAGTWAFGTSGARRLTVLAEAHADELAAAATIHEFMEVIRRLMREDGWKLETVENGPPCMGAQGLVVARPGHLWYCCSSFAHNEVEEGRPIGTGSGCDWAEGAALAALQLGATPQQAVRMGVEAAARYDVHTGQTVDVLEVVDQDARAPVRAVALARDEHSPLGLLPAALVAAHDRRSWRPGA